MKKSLLLLSKIVRFVLITVLFFSFEACSTLDGKIKNVKAPSIEEIDRNKIEELIKSNNPFKALQLLSAYEQRNRQYDSQFVAQARRDGIDLLVNGFSQALKEKDYLEAITYYKSLKNIGELDTLHVKVGIEWNLRRLYYLLAEEYEKAGNNYVTLFYYLRSLEEGNESKDNLLNILKLSRILKNRTVYQKILALAETQKISIPDKYRRGIWEKPDLSEMINGTVTIWINRGVSVEHGVGFPDRVIGSGFFIDSKGYLLTNYHVIKSEVDPEYEGYSRLFVKLSKNSEEKIPAKVVGYDRVFDIALVKVEVKPDFIFYPSDSIVTQPGDRVFAIGSPGGLENTVTSGIVSAVDRKFLQLGTAIQVDAPLNPGNSGGPLLNNNAELVGIVFAGIEQFEGVNFAIPWSWVRGVVPFLYDGGEHRESWLGLCLYESEKGLEVVYTVPDEPAEIAGLRSGDIIESVNGIRITKREELNRILIENNPKTLMRITWKRKGKKHSAVVSLDERPFIPVEVALDRDDRDRVIYPLFGMKLEKTGSFLWKTNYMVKRVLVGSVADETGISVDDPLNIQGWKVDKKKKLAILQIYIKKRKAGFLESVVQLAAYLETDNFY